MGKTLYYKEDEQPKVISFDLSDVENLYVNEKQFDEWKELNPSVEQLKPFNYRVITVRDIVGDTPEEDVDRVIITTESNAPIMALMYSKGFAANPNEMMLSEARAVTNSDLGNLLQDYWKSEITFNEFQYFTSITEVPERFASDSTLAEITLPPSVTTIGDAAFSQYYEGNNFRSINGLDNVERIEGSGFADCNQMPYMYFPKANFVGRVAFSGNGDREGYGIPRTVEFGLPYEQITFDAKAFLECRMVTIICNGVELTPEQYTALGAVKPEPQEP